MGGRAEREPFALREAEIWITEVSAERLTIYERMLSSPEAARVRADGSGRADAGNYFRDLIQRERERRASALF